MRTLETTQIIQGEFTNTYTIWQKTKTERDGLVRTRRDLEAEKNLTK